MLEALDRGPPDPVTWLMVTLYPEGVRTLVRVRFAPSPTGSLHIGGARTALFNWLFARHHGGTFVLRLEDTDLERSARAWEDQIMESLRWLGLEWDEGPDRGGPVGPYRQSERLEIYRAEVEKLLGKGAAYHCYCTPEELEARREEARRAGRAPRYDGRCRDLDPRQVEEFKAAGRRPVVRVRVPEGGATVVRDLIRGEVLFEHEVLDDFIIMKSNGLPTYNFACVVDDHHMRITHVIRAEEHLSNTPRQILLYQFLGYSPPLFAHVPMILAPDRSKLRKRHGATSVEEFRELGYLPEALVNYLALLGWYPGDEEEILSREEMVRRFSLEAVAKTPAVYDVGKLTWMNGQYLRRLPLEEVVERALPFFQAAGLLRAPAAPEEVGYLKAVLAPVRERVRTLGEAVEAARYFFRDDFQYEEQGVKKYFRDPGVADLLARGREALAGLDTFGAEEVERAYRDLMAQLGIPGKALIHPTRLALSGRTVGPGLFELMALLGKDRCLARLDRAVAWLRSGRSVSGSG